MDTPFTLGGKTFRSRLLVGTGKYPDYPTMGRALGASAAFSPPTALLARAESAVPAGAPRLREECLAAVREGSQEMEGSPLSKEFTRKLERVIAGEKDLFF